MNTNLAIHNKSLVTYQKSRKGIQNLKTLGITRRKYYSAQDRTRERYKKAGDRMRERFRKSKGLRKDGRRNRRRRRR